MVRFPLRCTQRICRQVLGALDQSLASLHEPLLQASQRPGVDSLSAARAGVTGCPACSLLWVQLAIKVPRFLLGKMRMMENPNDKTQTLRGGWWKNRNPTAYPNRTPRCGAKTRRSKVCQAPAMPNGRGRMHVGASTRPRTAEWLARRARSSGSSSRVNGREFVSANPRHRISRCRNPLDYSMRMARYLA